jgi:bifunctional non-homologous end joining protein LigD
MDGDDLRALLLSMRKASLAKLLRGRPDGAACSTGLEGLVSKRADRRYSGGRSKDWVKMKNRSHPAMERVKESFG